ncbi:hypothetical protein CC86DRAFT_436418 [Ophiobolus disseminans]|uniref:Uncharacterized protein n=1 Tax=Ophiobolus disseminans TaxID=1469910 RepID=A0A6A7AC57_9PLEO|nr:hypothetical protein CC86DRAFT_436418 [Ophiobolus disseminans]
MASTGSSNLSRRDSYELQVRRKSLEEISRAQRDIWNLEGSTRERARSCPVESRLSLRSITSTIDTVIAETSITAPEGNSKKAAEETLDLRSDARVWFLRRLIANIFIYTYNVPVPTLSRLPDEIWYSNAYTTYSLLTPAEHDFVLHLAEIVSYGLSRTTREDAIPGEKQLLPHNYHTIYTHIVEPCKTLEIPPDCIFDLLPAIPRHNFNPHARYKTLPHHHAAMLIHLKEQRQATIHQRHKLSKRLLSDAAVLRKVAGSKEMWTAIGKGIRIFGGKYMGRQWEEQIAEQDRGVVVSSDEARESVEEMQAWEKERRVKHSEKVGKETLTAITLCSESSKPTSGKNKKQVRFLTQNPPPNTQAPEPEPQCSSSSPTRSDPLTQQQQLALLLEQSMEEAATLREMVRAHKVHRIKTILGKGKGKEREHAVVQESSNDGQEESDDMPKSSAMKNDRLAKGKGKERQHTVVQVTSNAAAEYMAIVDGVRKDVGL